MCIHICIYIYIYRERERYMYICICMYVCIYTRIYTYDIHTHMYVYICVYVCVYIYVYLHNTYINICTHVHTHVHTHTHTRTYVCDKGPARELPTAESNSYSVSSLGWLFQRWNICSESRNHHVMRLLSILFLIRRVYSNERTSTNNHLIGKQPNVITSHDTPSPPTKSFDFIGFESSKLLIQKGGNSHVR